MASDYKIDLQKASAELADLYARLSNLEIEIARQQRRVAALKSLAESDEEFEIPPDPNLGGLTESISSVLKAAFPTPLTTFQIRDSLIALHFPVHNYKNFRGSLHTVLKRLVDNGCVERGEDPKIGEPTYRWTMIIRRSTLTERVNAAYDSGMRGDEKPKTLNSRIRSGTYIDIRKKE
jgi:hypothetical protein